MDFCQGDGNARQDDPSSLQIAARLLFRSPFRVNRVVLTARRSLPVYPDERTSSDRPRMSGWCHHRKSVDFSITSSVHSSLPKHLGSISKRPARFSSSHSMTPIAFLGACFWVDGQKQT